MQHILCHLFMWQKWIQFRIYFTPQKIAILAFITHSIDLYILSLFVVFFLFCSSFCLALNFSISFLHQFYDVTTENAPPKSCSTTANQTDSKHDINNIASTTTRDRPSLLKHYYYHDHQLFLVRLFFISCVLFFLFSFLY